MYIQENTADKERTAPPDYRGHTYVSQEPPAPLTPSAQEGAPPPREGENAKTSDSVPAGAFGGGREVPSFEKGSKRGDFFGNLGLGGLFSRIPLLSSLAPPSRGSREERGHGEIWDWVLLGVVVLCLLGGKEDDVLPLLLLLLLWD